MSLRLRCKGCDQLYVPTGREPLDGRPLRCEPCKANVTRPMFTMSGQSDPATKHRCCQCGTRLTVDTNYAVYDGDLYCLPCDATNTAIIDELDAHADLDAVGSGTIDLSAGLDYVRQHNPEYLPHITPCAVCGCVLDAARIRAVGMRYCGNDHAPVCATCDPCQPVSIRQILSGY